MIYFVPSFSKTFYKSVLSDQTINYVCPKLILIFCKIRRTVTDLRHYWEYIRQWNRNTMKHNGQRQDTGCQFYCRTYGYTASSDHVLMIRSHREFSHVVWQPWFMNIRVVRHRGFFMIQAIFCWIFNTV